MSQITHYRSSKGDVPIADMPYPHLVNAVNKRARELGGGTDPTLEALRAEIARRPSPDSATQPGPAADPRALAREDAAPATRPAPAPRKAAIGDNNPPTDDHPLKARLETDNEPLLVGFAELEIRAARLPAVCDSDEDIAKITAWVVDAKNLAREAESTRKAEKDPYLRAGNTIDGFFGAIKTALADRIPGLEKRKTAFLQARAAREAAERAAEAARLWAAQEEARQREEEERRGAAEAQHAVSAALRKLQEAEGPDAIDLAEAEYRRAARAAQLSTDAAEQAVKDAKAAGKVAERQEKILAGEHRTHVLGRVDAGGGSTRLKTTVKPEVHNPGRLMISLGALGPFLGDAAIDAALARAAKADPRPAIPGVDWVEDVTAETRATRG
jgi:hypothetical protein